MPRTLGIARRSMDDLVAAQGAPKTKEEDQPIPDTAVPETDDAPASEPAAAEISPANDAEDFIRVIARKSGWVPLEEWKREPSQWRDHRAYLEASPDVIKSLQERIRRNAQAADSLIEEERRRAREEAITQLRTAAEAQDPETAVKAAERLAQNSGPSARAQAWIAERTWFKDDAAARQLAVDTAHKLSAAGFNEAEQLEAADLAVQKRYPEYFPEARQEALQPAPAAPAPQGEVRMSELRRPPQVAAGARTTPSAPKERGYLDIPRGDRDQFERLFERRYTNRGMTQQQARDSYAQSYWREKGPA